MLLNICLYGDLPARDVQMRAYAWAVKNKQHFLRNEQGLPILFRTRIGAQEALDNVGAEGFRIEKVLVQITEVL